MPPLTRLSANLLALFPDGPQDFSSDDMGILGTTWDDITFGMAF